MGVLIEFSFGQMKEKNNKKTIKIRKKIIYFDPEQLSFVSIIFVISLLHLNLLSYQSCYFIFNIVSYLKPAIILVQSKQLLCFSVGKVLLLDKKAHRRDELKDPFTIME